MNVNNFLGFDGSFEESDIILFGAPYDGTASNKPGARFAPKEIRSESFGIETFSPYFFTDLTDRKLCDDGDLEAPFGSPEPIIDLVYGKTKTILKSEKKPLILGGEHLISLGAIKAAARYYDGVRVICFDAHADLREEYLGERLSHATVMRRALDYLADDGEPSLYQFGIRSLNKDECDFIETSDRVNPTLFDFGNFEKKLSAIEKAPVYLSLDLDVIDPSEFPATGTPEAGGVSFKDLIEAFKTIKRLQINIIGADVVEYSPVYDQTRTSAALACKVIRELANIM